MKHIFFSLGYRCSSAGILKYLNIKQESYPFDWLISRLPIIKDCIETDFQHFLKKENYKQNETQTIHYNKKDELKKILICNESIIYNTYYQKKFNNDEFYIPAPLKLPLDTYAHSLALNHRNILNDDDYDYFKRCIERFHIMIQNPCPKKYLHIHPVISIEEYEKNKGNIIQQFIDFHHFISSIQITSLMKGLFIIIVRTHYDNPITNYLSNILEKINTEQENLHIYILYTHSEFIDAGEIFMQNNNELETSTLINLVKSFASSPVGSETTFHE